MFKQFFANIQRTFTDEQENAKDALFIELNLSIDHLLKRPLNGSELRVVCSLDDTQTELIANLLKEAQRGEKRSTEAVR